MARKKIGRPKGRQTKGYFYRSGRGWYTKEGGRFVPLRYEDGQHVKDAKAERDAREAYSRFLLDRQRQPDAQSGVTLLEVCRAYLAHTKANGAKKTHVDRADTLFDFCFGIPPEYRQYCSLPEFRNGKEAAKKFTADQQKKAETKRLHAGYGQMRVADLRPLEIDEWLNSHTSWSQSGRRTRIQAVKRALNYAVERKLIASNPVRGYRAPKSHPRVTHITPAQEQSLLEHARPALAMAIKICIRTGARFGSEFATLTRKHVVDHGDRMEWVFQPGEIKNRRKRIIYITDADTMALVRQQMERHPEGPLFRNSHGGPWTKKNLSQRFRFLKYRLQKAGIEFDDDCCMYACRHTYAKRTLQGYWTGKPTNIETLARLMGNTPQVCREHYLQWSELDTEHLWSAA